MAFHKVRNYFLLKIGLIQLEVGNVLFKFFFPASEHWLLVRQRQNSSLAIAAN